MLEQGRSQERSSRRAALAGAALVGITCLRRHGRVVARSVRWGATLLLPLLTVWMAAINVGAKGAPDLYLLFMFVWLLAALWAIRRTRNARSFVLAVTGLLLLDTIADILAMGSWLHGPWSAVSQAGLVVFGRPAIVEWRWDLGVERQVTAYWTIFWGWTVPVRTAALLAGVVLGSGRWGRWLWSPVCLAVATFVLYAGHVEDLLYFALLGYLPFLTRTPLDYSYLPPTLGFAWNTAAVNTAAVVALIVAGVLFDVAIQRDSAAR